jgi:hypothetical protein
MLPNAREFVNRMAESIREGAILGAMAHNAIHGYVEDDISELQAFKKYGKAWIKDRTNRGQLHFSRIGSAKKSTKNYSIFEIETLKRAEKEVELMYHLALNNA